MRKGFKFLLLVICLLFVTACDQIVVNNDLDKLDAPVITLNDKTVSWSAVEKATDYLVYVNDTKAQENQSLQFVIVDENYTINTLKIKVKAIDSTKEYDDSRFSNELTYTIQSQETQYDKISEVKTKIDQNATGVSVSFDAKVVGFDSMGYAWVQDNTGLLYVRAKNDKLTLNSYVHIEGTGFVYTGSDNYPEYTRQIKSDGLVVTTCDAFEITKPVIELEPSDLNTSDKSVDFFSNIVSIEGIVYKGESKYDWWLNDENGNHIIQIHHYSSNFNNDEADTSKNDFIDYIGQNITLTGVVYRYYTKESKWTIQCIGLGNEIKPVGEKLDAPVITLNDKTVSWSAVEKATGYQVYIDGRYYDDVTTTTYEITEIYDIIYDVKIIAISDDNKYLSSDYSNLIVLKEFDDDFNILMINDTHGSFISSSTPGMDKLSGLVSDLEAANGDYLKIANGDIFQGSYESSSLKGLPMVDALNAMDFDAFVLGNHEFDWGIEEIEKYKDGDQTNGEANFEFLGANINDKKTGKMLDWVKPYVVDDINGIRVGTIGVIGQNLESSILYTCVKDYDFIDPLPLIQSYSKKLRNELGCDLVIVSIHSYEDELNLDIAELPEDSKIDAILCGHSHQYVNACITRSDGKNIPIIQNKDKNQTVLEIVLSVDENRNYDSYYGYLHNIDSYSSTDEMQDVYDKYGDVIQEASMIIGNTSEGYDEQSLGNMATTAMQEYFKTDISIINTGGVRTKIDSGDITVGEVFEVFPFENEVYVITMSGDKIKSLYNSNAKYFYMNTDFNVSEISDNTDYTVSVIDYVFTSTRYSEFQGLEYIDYNILMRNLIIDYLKEVSN